MDEPRRTERRALPLRRLATVVLAAALLLYAYLAVRASTAARASGHSTDARVKARAIHEAQRYEPRNHGPLSALLLNHEPVFAQATLRETLRLAPTWSVFHHSLGLSLLEAGAAEAAEAEFALARRFAPAFPTRVFEMGSAWHAAFLRTGDPAHLARAWEQFAAATAMEPRLFRPASIILARTELPPEQRATIVPRSAAARGLFGFILIGEDDFAGAAEAFEVAAAVPSLQSEALCRNLARARLECGETAAAEQWYRRAVELSPEPDRLVRSLYGDYADAGRSEAGQALWTRLADVQPVSARYNLARCHFDAGRRGPAYQAFQEVLDFGPDPDVSTYLIDLDLELDRLEVAEQRSRRALLYHPERAGLHFRLALALKKQGRAKDAIQSLTRAAELAPRYSDRLRRWKREFEQVRRRGD